MYKRQSLLHALAGLVDVAGTARLGDADLTSAFRPRRPEDRARLLAALQTIIDRAAPVRAGQEDAR